MKTILTFLAALGMICTAAAQAAPKLLVVTKQSHALAIVDTDTLKVLAHVPIGEDPHEVTVGPDNRTAYVSNYGEGTLHTLQVIDLVNQKALPPVDISPLRGPHGFTLHDGKFWITTEGSKSVALFNPATRQIESVLGTGQDKTHMLWIARDGTRLVAANAGSGTISIFDQVEVKPVRPPGAPPAPAAYTVLGWKHTMVPVGMGTEGFDVSPDGREVWAGNKEGTISIISLATEKVEASIAADVVGANRLRFTPDGKLLIATMRSGKELVVLDTAARKVIKRIPIEERGASGIQIQPDGKRAFIACPRDHYVAVVDLVRMEMTGKIEAGIEPDGLAWWEQ